MDYPALARVMLDVSPTRSKRIGKVLQGPEGERYYWKAYDSDREMHADEKAFGFDLRTKQVMEHFNVDYVAIHATNFYMLPYRDFINLGNVRDVGEGLQIYTPLALWKTYPDPLFFAGDGGEEIVLSGLIRGRRLVHR